MRNDLVRKETFASCQQDLRKLNMICRHFRWCWFKGVCVFVYIIVVSSAFLRLLTSRWNSKYNSYKTAVRWNLLHRADVSCSPQQPSAALWQQQQSDLPQSFALVTSLSSRAFGRDPHRARSVGVCKWHDFGGESPFFSSSPLAAPHPAVHYTHELAITN